MRNYILLFYLFTVVSFLSCTNNYQKKNTTTKIPLQGILDSDYHRKNFDSLMTIVCRETTALDYSEELLADSSFGCIYEHSSAYLEDAINLLSKEHFTDTQASVCIFAMQNLSVIDYARFCQFYVQLYDRNKISEGMLKQAILPNFLQKRIIPENYDDPHVIALLNDIKNHQMVSGEFKKEIANVLSGKYIKDLEN